MHSIQLIAKRFKIRQRALILRSVCCRLGRDDVIEVGNSDDETLSKLCSAGTFQPLLVVRQRACRCEYQVDVAESCHEVEHVRHVADECCVDPRRDGITSMSSVGSEDP